MTLTSAMRSYPVGNLDVALARSSVSDVLLPDYFVYFKNFCYQSPWCHSNCLDTVEYHPHARSVLMTSGMDKTLHIFKTEGATSDKIFSAKFKDMPISESHFNAEGTEIISMGVVLSFTAPILILKKLLVSTVSKADKNANGHHSVPANVANISSFAVKMVSLSSLVLKPSNLLQTSR